MIMMLFVVLMNFLLMGFGEQDVLHVYLLLKMKDQAGIISLKIQ